jgi:hypothetical protein
MRTALIILGVISLVALLLVGALISPFVYQAFRSSGQQRALQNRSDYPQIAAACVTLSRAVTNDGLIYPSDPIVPPLLRSLSFQYIAADSNHITMEFHGGFDHYGYHVRQSATDPKQWTISYYTEKSEKPLTTISHD